MGPEMTDSQQVDPVIRDVVERVLEELETSLDARVILAVDNGPRGMGTPAADSPHRIQFVYVRRLDWYLKLSPGEETIELPVSDDFSLVGWDIRHLLRTLRGKEGAATSWLRSAVTYRGNPELVARLVGLQKQVWQAPAELKAELDRIAEQKRKWQFGHTLTFDDFLKIMQPAMAAYWIAGNRGPVPLDISLLVEDMSPAVRNELKTVLTAMSETVVTADVPECSRSQIFIDDEIPKLQDVELAEPPPATDAPFDRLASDVIRRFG